MINTEEIMLLCKGFDKQQKYKVLSWIMIISLLNILILRKITDIIKKKSEL